MGFDPGKPVNIKVTPKAKAKPKPAPVVVPNADQQEAPSPARQRHRARVQAVVVKEGVREQQRQNANARVTPPDTVDKQRSPARQRHDQAVVAKNVASSRRKVVAKGHAGELARLVENLASGYADTKQHTGTVKAGSGPFAVTLPKAGPLALTPLSIAAHESVAAVKDAADLATGTPSSVAKLAVDTYKHPIVDPLHPTKIDTTVPKTLAAPYLQLAKHPAAFATEHPVTTALMVQPLVKVPGRAVGAVLRSTGRQTLERPPATLTGTALKETRTGSKDAVVRAVQSAKDKKAPAPEMTARQVHQRVDEFRDLEHRRTVEAVNQATNDAAHRTRHLPADQRKAAVEQARQDALTQARAATDERFAREFGATQRPSTGAAERELAARARRDAVQRVDAARQAVKATEAEHERALVAAKTARAKVKRSSTLSALETQRRNAQGELARAQRAQVTARVGQGVAKGRAQVLSRNVGGKAGGYGLKLAGDAAQAAADRVRNARAVVKDLDTRIATERQRISGVPPAEHQALLDAIHGRGSARAELAGARAAADAARAVHIATKRGMASATLTAAAKQGRLFSHPADAAKVAQRLNEQGNTIATGSHAPVHFVLREPEAAGRPVTLASGKAVRPHEFTVRQVGEDRYAVVPKAANERFYKTGGPNPPLSHSGVGSSKATGAKVMRAARTGMTQATLPFSGKWLGGQAGEAAVRAAVTRSGPLDLLRLNRVVKRLNQHTPGLGDALAQRITGSHAQLVGEAKEFAEGRSLAHEFEGTSKVTQTAARAATYAGHTAPLRAVRAGFRRYTTFVLHDLNSAIENTARKAMAGQAIRDMGLLDGHVLKFTDAAIEDAAKGLHATENQVALARLVNRMYGKYKDFSPEMRTFIMHWTPYLPWTLNVIQFLGKVLPHDHPVTTALLADANNAELEWRKQHGLSILDPAHVPLFMLGTYPKANGDYQPIGRYTPFGITDPAESAGSLVLPWLTTPVMNAIGVDWTGKPLEHADKTPFTPTEKAVRALASGAETVIPGLGQALQLTGIEQRDINKEKNVPSFSERAGKLLPTAAIHSGTPSQGKRTTKVPGRVQVPAVSGRVKLPGGGTGRIKLP